jgi:hypothetical protein
MIFKKQGESVMTFVEMVQFFEEGYALVQQLKASGVYDKVMAAEQAIQTELATDPLVKQLELSVQKFLAKQPTVVSPPKVSG